MHYVASGCIKTPDGELPERLKVILSSLGEVTMKAENEVSFTGDDAVRMQKLLDALEDCDDVQEVYTTAVIED